MAEEFHDITFLQADIDDCPETSNEFGIEVLPTVLLIQSGEVQETFIGQQVDKIRAEIRNILGLSSRKTSSTSVNVQQSEEGLRKR